MDFGYERFYECSLGRLVLLSNKGNVLIRDVRGINGWRVPNPDIDYIMERNHEGKLCTYMKYDCTNPNSPKICLNEEEKHLKGEGIPNPMVNWLPDDGSKNILTNMQYEELTSNPIWKQATTEFLTKEIFCSEKRSKYKNDELLPYGTMEGLVSELWASKDGHIAQVLKRTSNGEVVQVFDIPIVVKRPKPKTADDNPTTKSFAKLDRKYWSFASDEAVEKERAKAKTSQERNSIQKHPMEFDPALLIAVLFNLPVYSQCKDRGVLEHINKDYADCSLNNLFWIPSQSQWVLRAVARLVCENEEQVLPVLKWLNEISETEYLQLMENPTNADNVKYNAA